MKRKNEKSLFRLALTAIFIAIIAIMNFTSLGYIKAGVIEITLLTVPVAAGGILLGKRGGLILGAAFGITSFIQCFGMSQFGAAILAINPVLTLVVCMLPRLALGFFGSWIFEALSKTKLKSGLSAMISFLASSLINTVGFVGLLILFFGRSEYLTSIADSLGSRNMFTFFFLFAGINSLVEAAVCAAAGGALGSALSKLRRKINAVYSG